MIEIEAFVVIAEAGSFTRAATALHVSQPAISRRIELLERELGAPLFERIHSGVRLTDAGAAFLPHARRVLATVRDGAAAVHALETGESGVVTLALVGTLASTGLTVKLRAFREAHPGVRLRLRTARSDEVSVLVRQGDAALGLRYFPDPSASVVSLPVQDEQLVIVCAGHSHLVDLASIEPAALIGIAWIGFPTGTGSSGEPFTRVLEQKLCQVGLDGQEFIAIDSLTAQKRLIEAGFGVGMLPASSVDEELRLGTLHVLPIAALATTVPVLAIHRHGGYISPAAQRLLTAM
ncbi:MAG: LysR family transcriptional regulator [Chloroflexia bacterium]|nr:LysR family transcriptional regulator [Chloroflexia bacterium]